MAAFNDVRMIAVLQVIATRAQADCPEGDLWLSVIGQAIFDAHLSIARNRESPQAIAEARAWFASPDCELVCQFIDLDADWLRAIVKRFAETIGDDEIRRRITSQRRRLASRALNQRRAAARAQTRQRVAIAAYGRADTRNPPKRVPLVLPECGN